MQGRVQDFGCIALPESLQQQTGLYPGATYTLEVSEAGALLPRMIEPAQQTDPSLGSRCG